VRRNVFVLIAVAVCVWTYQMLALEDFSGEEPLGQLRAPMP
jgi:hypothetical protein